MVKEFDEKKFRNAMCGVPPDYVFWQDLWDKGDIEGVYSKWQESAKREEEKNPQREFWRVIINVIDYKVDNAKSKEHNLWLDKVEQLKQKLVEAGIHQHKPISVFSLDKIFRDVFLEGRKW